MIMLKVIANISTLYCNFNVAIYYSLSYISLYIEMSCSGFGLICLLLWAKFVLLLTI